jgi:ornithine lipid ester-linked acyl 2-hydroxylase
MPTECVLTTTTPGTDLQPGPVQTFGTDGVQEISRPSPVTRFFMRVVAWAERLNLTHSRVGNPPVYDNATFPWAAQIEREWPAIRAELDRVLLRKDELPAFHEIATDVATITRDRDWKTFLFCGYGFLAEQNIRTCPETWRILQKVPGLTTAMFSILEPGKHIPHHRGPYNGVLRLHLGLIIPEPRQQVAIRVDSQICHWEEGKALLFDDAYDHEAWNRTDKTRVVLFVDFVKPLRFPANLVNGVLLSRHLFVRAATISAPGKRNSTPRRRRSGTVEPRRAGRAPARINRRWHPACP